MSVLTYNGYTFNPTPIVTVVSRSLSRETEARQGDEITWTLKGVLLAKNGTITTQLASMATALADGHALELKDDSGATLMSLPTSGVLVTGQPWVKSNPNFPVGQGAEFATIRNYEISFTAGYARGSPTPNAVGHYSTTVETLQDGSVIERRSGEYRGNDCLTAANNALLTTTSTRFLMREAQTVDAFEATCRFDYEYKDWGGRAVYEYSETIHLMPARVEVAIFPKLGGGFITQNTVDVPAIGRQRGRAVGLLTYPSAPANTWAPGTNLIKFVDQGSGKTGPTKTADGAYTGYAIEWDREFTFATTPAFPSPTTN